jgi:biopolymer transport protein TolQ
MSSTMEHMSLWGLVSDASWLVKAVMLTLLAASLCSWYLIVQRAAVLRRREQAMDVFVQRLRGAGDLLPLYRDVAGASAVDSGAETLFRAGMQEFTHLAQGSGNAAQVIEGVERALGVALSEQEIQLEKSLAFLATVGSVSPYIGLFGTVWGIMNSFIGLSQVQQATLSTVAPGIAEALIATAIGLFAAIPAVVAYNRFAARSQTLLTRYYALANELQVRLHRTLHGTPLNLAVAA